MNSPASDIARLLQHFPPDLRDRANTCAEALRAALRCELWHLTADSTLAEIFSWTARDDVTPTWVFGALEEKLGIKWDGDRSEDNDAVTFRELVDWLVRADKRRRRKK